MRQAFRLNIHASGKQLMVTGLLLGVGLLSLIGCNGSHNGVNGGATPTPTATPTLVLGTLFSSPDNVYTFQFPGAWSTQSLNNPPVVNGEQTESPDTSAVFIALPLNQIIAPAQYGAFFTSFLTNAGGTQVMVGSSPQSVTLGANAWTTYTATLTFNNAPSQATQYALARNGQTYFLMTIAATSAEPMIEATNFMPMVASFTFTK